MANDPRYPQNLQGLLRFALQHTRSEDAPNVSSYEQMDPERKKFLEDALKSMTVDVVEELEKTIGVLEDPASSNEEKLQAIETIQDYVDNLDFANSFVKIGGSKVIVSGLESESPEIRAASASLLAEMSQNNPFCQKNFLDMDLLPKLIQMLCDEQSPASSAMHAISCLVRSYEPGLAEFIKIGGLECILGCLESKYEKIVIKACFLISFLSSEFIAVRDELIKLEAVEKLIDVIKHVEVYDVRLETVLSAINALTETDAGAERCRSTNLNFQHKLESIIKIGSGKPEFEEIVDFSKNLLSRCFVRSSHDVTDR